MHATAQVALGNATVWCVAPSTYEAVWGARFFEQLRLPGAESYPKRSAIHGVHWSWQMCDLHAVVGALHHLRGADTQQENPAWKMCHERIGLSKGDDVQIWLPPGAPPRNRRPRLRLFVGRRPGHWLDGRSVGVARRLDASDADLLTTDGAPAAEHDGVQAAAAAQPHGRRGIWSSLLVPVRYSVRMLATLSLLVGSGRLSFCESRAATRRRAPAPQRAGRLVHDGRAAPARAPTSSSRIPKFSCCNAISEDAMAEARLVEAVGDGVAGRLVHRVRPKGATLLA